MNNVLKELCRGAEWSEKDLQADATEINRAYQFFNNLKDSLTSSQLSTLKKLMKCEYDLHHTENIRFFISGFRLGMSLKSDD